MPAKIMFTVRKGSLSGKTFSYEGKESLIVGRHNDCSIVLPEVTVSRYHCLIDIVPPSVMVKDFGSLNGTYLNGEKIGQREADVSADQTRICVENEFNLKSGDILGIGKDCELVLDLQLPQYCADCSCEINDGVHSDPEGLPICVVCHKKRLEDQKAAEAAAEAERKRIAEQEKAERLAMEQKAMAEAERRRQEEERKRKEEEERKHKEQERLRKEAEERKRRNNRKCEVCGKTIGGNEGGICLECQKNPMKVLLFLMEQAHKGAGDAKEIAGYRNIKLLGEGGMGQVWLVEEERTGERMALKLMLPKAAVDEASREAFLREANVAGQLVHENIVRQLKLGQSGNTYFILMELCDGGSVDSLIQKSGGTLSIDMATKIIVQTLDGLNYAHNATLLVKLRTGETVKANGVVHRDFKPGNIFLAGQDKKLTAKVADFGLAKAFETSGLSGHTASGGVAGTPVFMPRQQIINFKYAKPDVDVWAAAASYYYMLTGALVKDFSSGKNIISEALTKDAVPIRKRNSSIPGKLAQVIDHVLIEKPRIGVGSAAELKRMIEGAF